MKCRLLKKLRRKIVLRERNGMYKVFDNEVCAGGIYNQTEWMDKKRAYSIRRQWILKNAQRYKTHKKTII